MLVAGNVTPSLKITTGGCLDEPDDLGVNRLQALLHAVHRFLDAGLLAGQRFHFHREISGRIASDHFEHFLGDYLLSRYASDVLLAAEAVDYPAVLRGDELVSTLASLEDALKYAVAAGDRDGLNTAQDKALAFRAQATALGKLPGKQATSARLLHHFDLYFQAASDSAAVMLDMRKGDLTDIVQSMQSSQAILRKELADFISAAEVQFEGDLLATHQAIDQQLWIGGALALLIIVAITAVSFLLIPSITNPIQKAVSIAQAMARGDLSGTIEVHGKDEMALLLGAMKSMVDSFKQFVAAQQELARRHAAGEISHLISAQEFPGIYGELAHSTNELARSHIAIDADRHKPREHGHERQQPDSLLKGHP